jgi:hypothetical protein
MTLFSDVFTYPESYHLSSGARYTDLKLYEPLYELSKTNNVIRSMLIVQMTNHELAAHYNMKEISHQELVNLQSKLIGSNFALLSTREIDEESH